MYDVPAWKNICPPSVPLLGPKNKLPSEDTDVAPIDTIPLTWRVETGDVVPIPTLPPVNTIGSLLAEAISKYAFSALNLC